MNRKAWECAGEISAEDKARSGLTAHSAAVQIVQHFTGQKW